MAGSGRDTGEDKVLKMEQEHKKKLEQKHWSTSICGMLLSHEQLNNLAISVELTWV